MLETDMSKLYTLMPMFLPQAPDSLNYDDLLFAMTRDQGYEAHCAAMEWHISAEMWGAMGKFFSHEEPPKESFYNGGGYDPTIFHGVNPYIVDFTRGRIPMTRGLNSTVTKNSSFEGMFGANRQTIEDAYELNSAGVAKRLLSSYQQCLAKTQNIIASAMICDETVDNGCTLNVPYSFDIIVDEEGNSRTVSAPSEKENLPDNEWVEHVAFYPNALRGWFAEIRPDLHGKDLYQQVCFDITGGDSTNPPPEYDPPPVDKVKIAKLREAVAAIPIDLDSLYRLAFLVLSPKQDKGKEDDDDKFFFLQNNPPAQIDSYAHAPIFIAFKIPDFGTNKSRAAGNIDTLELTKMVLQNKEQNEKDIEDQTKRREQIYEAAKRATEIENPDDKAINCPSFYPQCRRSGENALNNVLEDMVNGINLRCYNDKLRIIETTTDENGDPIEISGLSFNEKQAAASAMELIFNQEDLSWEEAGDLFTPANKDIKPNEYKGAANTHVANWLGGSKSNPFEWELIIDSEPVQIDPPMKVNAYIILPIGETIKDVNKALTIFWDEESFFEMIKTNVIEDMKDKNGKSKVGAIPKHYPIRDAQLGFSAVASKSPLDECVYEERIDVYGNPYMHESCKRYTFGIGFSEEKGEMLIPDFGLGFMIRKIQQKLRNTYNATYDYILSCQRVEDMFLGRCSGDPKGQTELSFCDGEAFKNIKNLPNASGIPQIAQDTFTSDIAPRITPEMIEAYKYAEEQTGIPCEVVAGIHWTEAGLDPTLSVFSGAPLTMSLKDDAKAAMEHLISLWPGSFDKGNIPYEQLAEAIGSYNGPGNMNCSSDPQGNVRATHWREDNKCPAQFTSEDHPHPLSWIDDRHLNMDSIYCVDFIEWSCRTIGEEAELQASADYIREWMSKVKEEDRWSEEKIQAHVLESKGKCYSGAPLCQTQSDGGKYVKYERPGSITVAILLNESGAAQ